MVRAGDLREVLTIQSATGGSGGQGGTSAVAATTVGRFRRLAAPGLATELLQAESVGSHADYQFRIRVRAGINAGQTIVWTPQWPAGMSALTLQILGVQPEPGRQSMLLTCAVVQ